MADSMSRTVDTSVRASDFQGDLKKNISLVKLKPVWRFVLWTRECLRKDQLTSDRRLDVYIHLQTRLAGGEGGK